MKLIFSFSVFVSLFLFSGNLFAEIKCKITLKALDKPFDMGLGQKVELSLATPTNPNADTIWANFLGRARSLDHNDDGVFFLDPYEMRIHFLPMDTVQVFSPDNQTLIPSGKWAPLIRSVNQQGGTCAAYAIYNAFRQLHSQGFYGNGMIIHHLANEISRSRFMVDVAMNYYGDKTHVGAEREVAEALGFNISSLNSRSPRALDESIDESSENNWPMWLRFDVGSPMSQTPYAIFDHSTQREADRRLWLPQRPGQPSSGGHQIMIAKRFMDARGGIWFLVVDSNWQAPRLWSHAEVNQLASAALSGWTVSQSTPNPSVLPPEPKTPLLWEDDVVGRFAATKDPNSIGELIGF